MTEDGLPARECLAVAAATPVTADFAPDHALLAQHCAMLLGSGCDGIALFGTTGEGPEFTAADRKAGLEAVLGSGIAPGKLVVSATALSIGETVDVARHAVDARVDSILLMPPCMFRSNITAEGTYQFYATVIDRIARDDLRLCLYHFPDICGVPLTPPIVRRLDEAFPGIITGVKDSGGDFGFTESMIRSCGHLRIYTGSEIHIPQALAAGAYGTICGLGNIMPRLLRTMFDAPTAFDRRLLVPLITSGDLILSRQSFGASIKSVLAQVSGEASWARMLPPQEELHHPERGWMVADFERWERSLPPSLRSFYVDDALAVQDNVLPLRRAL
ncbi:MAG: dihydrodipicolinate synthase family protein [Mesorhizobium sp.]|nr:dihydrodipicolinate synthase family protein [Mesorhizobium sp.]MBL8577679.1 dihydrodipicolinate synthase family protein [Mesorhizobium sp.]